MPPVRAVIIACLWLTVVQAYDLAVAADRPCTRSFTTPDHARMEGRSATIITSIAFEGNTVYSDQTLQDLVQPYVGQAVDTADLEDLRYCLTQHYITHYYVNSGAVYVTPEQPVQQGILRIKIIEGHLSDIRVRGNGRLREGYIKNRLWPKAGQPLNTHTLQQNFQLLLTDPLIKKLNGKLLPGTEHGSSQLDLEVELRRPYQLSLQADNYRPPSIGAEAVGFDGWVRNLTGLGDFLDFSLMSSSGADRFHGYWAVPLNDYGTQAYFSFDEGGSSVVEASLSKLNINSQIHTLEGGLSHTLYEDLNRRFSLGGSFGVRENETQLLNQPFSFVAGEPLGRNQATVLRFHQEQVERRDDWTLALRSSYSVGIDALGATPQRDPRYPDSEFFAWLGQAQYVRSLMDNGLQLHWRGNLQFADDPLLPLERIAVGGANTVRGYRENQLVRDNGYSTSLELHWPVIGADRNAHYKVTLIPFMDYGAGWNRRESAQHLHSLGLGFHWDIPHLHTEFYWAHRLQAPQLKQSGDLQDEGIHFSVRLDAF